MVPATVTGLSTFIGDGHFNSNLYVGGNATVTGDLSARWYYFRRWLTVAYMEIVIGKFLLVQQHNVRATPLAGMMRWNQTLITYEGYDGTQWGSIGGGATGSGTDRVFVLNEQTVNTTYTNPRSK